MAKGEKAYWQRPDVKAWNRERMRVLRRNPEWKEWRKSYRLRPEVKAKEKLYRQKAEVIARNRKHVRNYRQTEKGIETTRDAHRERMYGLTKLEYQEVLVKQHGGCAICGSTPGLRPLNVDHDHTTNKVRGLLCSACNSELGMFRDDERL